MTIPPGPCGADVTALDVACLPSHPLQGIPHEQHHLYRRPGRCRHCRPVVFRAALASRVALALRGGPVAATGREREQDVRIPSAVQAQ